MVRFHSQAHFAASPLDLPSLLSRYPSIELPSLEPEFQFRTGPDTSAKTNTERPVSRESSLSPTVANSPLAGHTLTRALKVLAEFLTLKRPGIVTLVEPRQSSIGSVNKASSDHSPAESAPSHGLSPQHQATLLDTALLQALLSTDSVKQARQLLEGPNFCHVATCEPLLSAAGRFEELLALFKSHGAHREALDLLKRLAEDGSGGSAFGHERLAEYLKQLGSEHTGLVLDYSKWLLEVRAPSAMFAS